MFGALCAESMDVSVHFKNEGGSPFSPLPPPFFTSPEQIETYRAFREVLHCGVAPVVRSAPKGYPPPTDSHSGAYRRRQKQIYSVVRTLAHA